MMDMGFDTKARKRELMDFFENQIDIGGHASLNGWEGLLVWGYDGKFYQMSYKNADNWSITVFPYDNYGMKEWNGEEWVEK